MDDNQGADSPWPGGASIWKTVDVLACTFTFSPHPQQIEAARQGDGDWWHALRWVEAGLITGGMLRDVVLTTAMTKALPFKESR